MIEELRRGDALIIVDVQRDFCEGGALPVPDGDAVVAILNPWIAAAERAKVPVFASRDWHPSGHPSFRERGGPWPSHCVQGTSGAQFHPRLRLPGDVRVVCKGARFDRDQYSAFDETGLASELRRLEVRRLWIGGLAQDVCVRATVLDALRGGFVVNVISDATRATSRASLAAAFEEMRSAGASLR